MPSDPLPPRYSTAQRRLLTFSAGLGVVVLAGATFALSYDDLRALAIEGRAARRWAPAYPVIIDALVSVTILSLVVARHGRWWTRWSRWALLLVVLGGLGAASAQRSLKGYAALPDDPLRLGVAIAPYVALLIAVWLWLTMFKQVRTALARRPAPAPAEPADQPTEPYAGLADLPGERTPDRPYDMIPGLVDDPAHTAQAQQPTPAEAAEPQPDPAHSSRHEDTPAETPRPSESWLDAEDELPEPADRQDAVAHSISADATDIPPVTDTVDTPGDDEPTPPVGVPALLPTDVELVRRRPKGKDVTSTTQPDIVAVTQPDFPMPSLSGTTGAGPAGDPTDSDPALEVVEDRAEDPDAGELWEEFGQGRHRLSHPGEDPLPAPPELDTEEVERWSAEAAEAARQWADEAAADIDNGFEPPSGKFRSSPTPPRD